MKKNFRSKSGVIPREKKGSFKIVEVSSSSTGLTKQASLIGENKSWFEVFNKKKLEDDEHLAEEMETRSMKLLRNVLTQMEEEQNGRESEHNYVTK